jgi:predicted porin
MHTAITGSPARAPRSGLFSAIVVAAALGSPVAAWAQSSTISPQTQLWTEFDAVAPLSSNFSITGIGQLRVSDEPPNPALTALGMDVNYKFGGTWTLSLGYLHQVTGNREENPNITQLVRLTSTYAYKFGRSTLLVRGRLQDNLTSSSNPWQVRLRAEYRWATDNLGPIAYLYTNDEIFYQFSNQELFRNRFQVGANLNFTQRLSARVYYQYQNTKNNEPKVINALGILAVYAFD